MILRKSILRRIVGSGLRPIIGGSADATFGSEASTRWMKTGFLIGLGLFAVTVSLLCRVIVPAGHEDDSLAHPTLERTAGPAYPPPDQTETAYDNFPAETLHWKRLSENATETETVSLSESVVKTVTFAHDPLENFPVRFVERRITDPRTGAPEPEQRYAMVGNRVMVSVDSYSDYEALDAFSRERDYSLSEFLDFSPIVLLEIPDPDIDSVPSALEELEAALPLLAAEPDYLLYPANTPNDPWLNEQWGLAAIDAFGAWNEETGSPEVYVAVLDTGIDRYHVDLEANIADDLGRNFASSSTSGDGNFEDLDPNSHGTRVSGVIGAVTDNATGIAGVSWDSQIIPIRVGSSSFPTSNIIRGLDYVTGLRLNQGVPVVAINNSYGGTSLPDSEGLRDAIVRSANAGILFVAAAGNSGNDMDSGSRFYPASYDVENIIAVASTTNIDTLYSGSNYGAGIVHLGAPGVGIYTTSRNNTYFSATGTSFAAPFVSGVLALMASANPELEMLELKQLLLENVDPLPSLEGRTITGGRLNAERAVGAAGRLYLRWGSPAAGFLRLPENGAGLYLEVNGERGGLPESLSSEFLDWETLSGPAEIDFSGHENNRALASFPVAGEYRLQATYQDDGRTRFSKPITIIAGPPVERPGDGLAAHWSFNEETGTGIFDLSGQDRGGSLDTASRDEGLFGGALRFDGLSSRATAAAPGVARVAFSAWVKSDSRGGSAIALPRILETDEHTLFWGRISNQEPNNDTVKFVAQQQDNAMGVWHTEPLSIDDGEWHHIAVSYDGTSESNDPVIYIDGRAAAVFRQVSGTGPRSPDAESTLWLGNSPDFDRAWDGLIDEVRVYERLLEPVEVTTLAYRAPAGTLQYEEPVTSGVPHTLTASLPETPENAIAVTWDKGSGPGEVTFDDPECETATAVFSEPGTYTLSLSANDRRAITVTEFTIEVAPEPIEVSVSAESDTTLAGRLHPVEIIFQADRTLSSDRTIHFTLGGDAQIGEHFRIAADPDDQVIMPAGADSVSLHLTPLARESGAEERTVTLAVSPAVNLTPASPSEVTITLRPYTFANWLDFYFDGKPAGEAIPESAGTQTGDGLPKLLKYALGIHPGDTPVTAGLPRSTEVDVAEAKYPALSYTRPMGPTDIEYRVEISDTLEPGSWSTDSTVVHASEDLPDGRERVVVRDSRPVAEPPQRFFRLKILLPDDDS